MRTGRLGVCVLALAMLAAACGGDDAEGTDEAGLESVTVALPNLRSIQYFPLYIADAGGYFEDEGLDVTIEVVAGSGAVIQQLIAGNVDISVLSPTAAINAVAGGQADIVSHCSTHYRNIFSLVTPSDSGVASVADLEGQTVGITEASGGEVPLVRAALATAGLAEGEDYQLLPVGEGGPVTFEALNTGDVIAYSSSVFDVAAIEAQGLDLTPILPDELLFTPSIGMSVMRETFDERTDFVVGFTRAYNRAQEWASMPENRDDANAMLETYDPELFEDPTFADAVWEATFDLVAPPEGLADAPLCSHNIAGWETYVEAALETPVEDGGLAGTIDIPSVADESLLDQINDYGPDDIDPPNAG